MKWVSNLHLIMAFVRMNAKEATTVAMRTLSALHGKEEKADFEGFLTDLGTFSTKSLRIKSLFRSLGARCSVIVYDS